MSEVVIALETLAREIASIKHEMERVRGCEDWRLIPARFKHRRDGVIAAYGVVLNMILEKQLEVEA